MAKTADSGRLVIGQCLFALFALGFLHRLVGEQKLIGDSRHQPLPRERGTDQKPEYETGQAGAFVVSTAHKQVQVQARVPVVTSRWHVGGRRKMPASRPRGEIRRPTTVIIFDVDQSVARQFQASARPGKLVAETAQRGVRVVAAESLQHACHSPRVTKLHQRICPLAFVRTPAVRFQVYVQRSQICIPVGFVFGRGGVEPVAVVHHPWQRTVGGVRAVHIRLYAAGDVIPVSVTPKVPRVARSFPQQLALWWPAGHAAQSPGFRITFVERLHRSLACLAGSLASHRHTSLSGPGINSQPWPARAGRKATNAAQRTRPGTVASLLPGILWSAAHRSCRRALGEPWLPGAFSQTATRQRAPTGRSGCPVWWPNQNSCGRRSCGSPRLVQDKRQNTRALPNFCAEYKTYSPSGTPPTRHWSKYSPCTRTCSPVTNVSELRSWFGPVRCRHCGRGGRGGRVV